jgi:hypothetical protein
MLKITAPERRLLGKARESYGRSGKKIKLYETYNKNTIN